MDNQSKLNEPQLARRQFLKLSGMLGLGTLASAFRPAEKAQAVLFNRKEYKVSETRLAMGTFVAMTAFHASTDQAEEAFGRAFDEITRLTALLSRHRDGSPVGELNREGRLSGAQPEVQKVVAQALYYNHLTNGAFDITVLPLVELYQRCAEQGRLPGEAEVDGLLDSVGSAGLIVSDGTIRFARENMAITLDGIAKGYIVDRASDILRRHGVVNHLINAGGDIKTSGLAAEGRKWTVAIQDPSKNRHYPDVIAMTSGAIATSGNYEVFYDREKVFHHIVNSRSGLSPLLSASVSVTAPTVMEADALSTAVFVLEPADGVAFIDRLPDNECFIVERDGRTRVSSGWQV